MKTKLILSAVLASSIGLPALAGSNGSAPAYPYHAKANNCPSGLQPIVMGGVICCGTPNQSHSYQSMMSHPVKKKAVKKKRIVRRVAKVYCPEGMKGCISR